MLDIHILKLGAHVYGSICGDTLYISGHGDMYNLVWAHYLDEPDSRQTYVYGSDMIPYHCQIKYIVVAPGVTSIGDFACSHLPYLTAVYLPNTINHIGVCAFGHNHNLQHVFMASHTTIDVNNLAFLDCKV